MAKLKCEKHGRRVQISAYRRFHGHQFLILHRSDTSRCDTDYLTSGIRSFSFSRFVNWFYDGGIPILY